MLLVLYSSYTYTHRHSVRMASRVKQDLMEGMKGVKGLLSIAKNDFVNNSKDLKQDFKDILEMARAKRRSKQESKPLSALDAKINPDAGAELLSHYRHQWSAIHKSIQSSSEVLQSVDAIVTEAEQNSRKTKEIIAKCHSEFSQLPTVLTEVQKVHEKVLKIEECLKNVEEAIMEYCQVAAKAEAHKKKRADTVALDTYRTVMHLEVERYGLSLAEEQQSLNAEMAKHEQEKLQERQSHFGELFERQMSEYKERGEVERPIMENEQVTSLENITLDNTDEANLDQFLGDVGPDDVTTNANLEESLESEPDAAAKPSAEQQEVMNAV